VPEHIERKKMAIKIIPYPEKNSDRETFIQWMFENRSALSAENNGRISASHGMSGM
jgi:hypothetical protein